MQAQGDTFDSIRITRACFNSWHKQLIKCRAKQVESVGQHQLYMLIIVEGQSVQRVTGIAREL